MSDPVPEQSNASGNRAKILIADNSDAFRATLESFLLCAGYLTRTASSPVEARKILESEHVDLAIIDLRLFDDTDDKDVSGLALAKEVGPRLPKIIMTGYLAVEDLQALVAEGGVIRKQDGLEELLQSVKLGLLSLEPVLKRNLLAAFQSTTTAALPGRMREVGPDEATIRVLASLDSTRAELKSAREREHRRASQHHTLGLSGVAAGLAVILVGVVMLMAGRVTASVASMVVSLVIDGISALLFVREDAAHKRVREYYEQLEELNRIGNLVEICEGLGSSSDRDKYRKKILDQMLDRWSAQPPNRAAVAKSV